MLSHDWSDVVACYCYKGSYALSSLRERERECVCVCVRERERELECSPPLSLHKLDEPICFELFFFIYLFTGKIYKLTWAPVVAASDGDQSAFCK